MSILSIWNDRSKKDDSVRICRNPDNGVRQGWFGSFVPQYEYLPEVVAKDDWAAIAKAVNYANPKDCVWQMLEVWPNCTLEQRYLQTLVEHYTIGDMLEVLDAKAFDPVFIKLMGKSPLKFFRDILAETHSETEWKKQDAFKRKLAKNIKPEHFKAAELARIRREQQEEHGYFEFAINGKTLVGMFSDGVGMPNVEVLETKAEQKKRLEKEREQHYRLMDMQREQEHREFERWAA